MRWAGEGSDLWRVRVDLFAERREPVKRQMTAIIRELERLLTESDGEGKSGIGGDGGLGVTKRPVIGLLFWVRADDVGTAATTAVDIARRAGANEGAGPGLYDVVVIPRDAVVLPNDPDYPRMPD